MAYEAKTESTTLTGANLSGSSGDANRTFTLTYSNAIYGTMRVFVAGSVLQPIEHFTFDSSTNKITFLNKTWNDMPIFISYSVFDTPTGSSYATTLQVARASGMGVEVELENIGTGDNSEKSFDLNNGFVLEGSYTIYHAVDGSNDLTALSEGTHYSINKNAGTILLTTSGVTEVGTDKIYISYTYSPKMSDTVLATYLAPAEAETDDLTGNYWGTVKTSYQYFDGYDSGYPQTDKPYGEQIDAYPEFELKYRSIAGITKIEFLDKEGNIDTTLDTDQYRVITDDDHHDGRVLIDTSIPNGKANVKITFTHGYSEVPAMIQDLTALLAGVRALVYISGGSYKDISTYSIGKKSFSIGQIYVNIESSIKQMKMRIDDILNNVGFRYGIV